MRAQSELETTQAMMLDAVNQTEAVVRNNEWIACRYLDHPDSLALLVQRIVQENPLVVGSTVALVPGVDRRHPLCAPYACRVAGGDGVELKDLATEEYDYPGKEWFAKPLESAEGYWSEPYIDEGGGEVMMTTYSLPIRDSEGRLAAVLTADISVDWLRDLLGGIEVYPSSFGVMVSREGRIMISPADTVEMHQSLYEIRSSVSDTTHLARMVHSMMAGLSGHETIIDHGEDYSVYYVPVERLGWSVAVVIPEKEVYASIRRIGALVTALQLLGLLMLGLILLFAARSQIKYHRLNASRHRMESELKIGHDIQMAMIPKVFPPFPERTDIDLAASIVPVKEVGGDLYDFYIRDEKLFFCVGDVSGKGIPASLVMAVTRSLFRSVSGHEKSPQRIVTTMNESMSEMNEKSMFVTFFCGVLDLHTGHLRYCNAGHNPPLILTDDIRSLPVEPNLPLGVVADMTFGEQEADLAPDDALFLYTDGLTEAENLSHEQFGDQRVKAVLHGRRDAQGHLEAIQRAVSEFVGDADPSDDLTMLFVHYLGGSPCTERHLTLNNEIGQISLLAAFMEDIASDIGLDPSLATKINLALEEAVTNVICYAYPKGSDGLVDIDAHLLGKSLEFVVSDTGKPFDPTAVPEADTSLGVAERPIGGLGIHLVRKIMDSVSYARSDGKNILTMKKNI